MGFKNYAGTKFVPFLLPIIPRDATLSPNSKLTPDKLGKIPGWHNTEGWVGFAWQKHITPERQLGAYAKMYAGGVETIGVQASKLPGLDIDLSQPVLADEATDIAIEEMGAAPIRGRENSPKRLLMYRIKSVSGEEPMLRKMRHVYEDAFGERGAVEFLGHGQQYLIEGMHSSGVPYKWIMGMDPLTYEYDNLSYVTAEQVESFFARLDDRMASLGWHRVKGGDTMRMSSSLGAPSHEVGRDHPELCPDLDMLTDVLQNYLPCDHPEFSTYEEWSTACIAIVTAAGQDEPFYREVFLPWMMADPRTTEEEYVRAKWESVRQSSIGWSYIVGIAHDYGYTADVEALMPALPPDPDRPDQTATPSGPPRNSITEQALAEQFVKRYARKELIHIPAKSGGHWRRCIDGIWVEDFTAGEDAARICAVASDAIRASANATPAQLQRADALMSRHSQEAVLGIAKTRSAISVKYELLDSHPLIMGIPNGFIDETGKPRDPDPRMLLSRRTGVRPDFDAKCPMFDKLVLSLANFDKDVEECLWGLIGYTACGLGDQQKFPFLFGKNGREGKTTFFTILGKVFGNYGKTFKPAIFMRGQDNRFAMAPFDGAWFLYGSEIAKGSEWDESSLKTATGGGQTPIEKKYLDAFEMWIRFMPWFSGNNMPRFRGNDLALKRAHGALSLHGEGC